MGDFFLPQPGGSAPPPEPDIPPPDFQEVGKGISAGFEATDWTGALAKKLWGAITYGASLLLSWIIKAAATIAAGFLNVLTETDEKANSAYGLLTAATLEHLFGVQINPRDVAGRGQREQRVVVANTIGQAIFGALFAAAPTSGAGGLRPSSAASEQYLQTVTHLGLEGWMESWIVDALSLHELQRFGELKDVMAEMLGLGRLTRRVLAPPMKILVEDPYTWKLNDTYRPTLLPHELATRQFLRGKLTRDQLDQVLGWQGWSPANIDYLINSNAKFLSLADLDYQIQRGFKSEADAVQYLRDQGWDQETATSQVSVFHERRIDVYRKELIQASEQAFIDKDIDADTFRAVVQTSGLPEEEQSWIIKVAGARREMKFKRLTLSEIEQLIRAGIMNVDDLRQWMLRENYSFEDAQFLELLLIDQVTTKAAADKAKAEKLAAKKKADAEKAKLAAQKQALLDAQAADKGVTRQQAAQLVKDGQWTFDQYAQFLTNHGVGPDGIVQLTDLLHTLIDDQKAAQDKRDAAKAAAAEKEVPLAQIEAGVKSGVVSMDEFRAFLTAQKYGQDDIDTFVSLLQSQIDAAKLKAKAVADAKVKAAQKHINLPSLERAVRLGLVPIESYRAALQAAGEDPTSADLLVGILRDQIAADTATQKKRADASLRAGAQGLSLAQTEQAVINHVLPMSAYTLLLGKLNFDQADTAALAELLQLRVDHQQTANEKQALADQKADATGLSLAAIQRATKLGVLSLDQYTALLARIGLSQDDVAILRTSMLVELQKMAGANKVRTAAASKLAKQGLSLAQEESAVIAGVESVDLFKSNLLAQGVTDANVTTIVDLVMLKKDQAEAAAAKRAIAEARAADKDPGLAKEEALVSAGIISMDDYGAYLRELKMDDLDIAQLEALLADKIGAAQAKAAAAGTQPAPGAAPKKRKRKAAAAPTTAPLP